MTPAISEVVSDIKDSLVQSVKFRYKTLKCDKCGELKPEIDFEFDTRTRSGRKKRCKECVVKFGAISPYYKQGGVLIGKGHLDVADIVKNANYVEPLKVTTNGTVSIPEPQHAPVPLIVKPEAEVKPKSPTAAQKVIEVMRIVVSELESDERLLLADLILTMDGRGQHASK